MVVGSLIPNCYCKLKGLIVCRFKFDDWYRIVICALPYTCTGHVYTIDGSSLFPLPLKKRESGIEAKYLASWYMCQYIIKIHVHSYYASKKFR